MRFAYLFLLVNSQNNLGSLPGSRLASPTEEFPAFPDGVQTTTTHYSKQTGKPRDSGCESSGSTSILFAIVVIGMLV
jgi:hypothetical protein